MGSPPAREAVPAALLEYDHWISWREGERDGKTTKVPIEPETGEFASTTDPETWTAFETAAEHVQFGAEAGVGFVFSAADPFVGVDLDDCRDPETGQVDDWAHEVIDRLDSFTEVSPSGSGFHVLLEGSLPGDRNRRGDLECYETARFFTVTAEHVPGTPSEIRDRSESLTAIYEEYLTPTDEPSSSASRGGHRSGQLDDAAVLEKAQDAANGAKFQRLWRGSTSGYESHSEADMALCSLLAFWTGGDAAQMDRLFRESGLMREKWDDVHYADGSTYGEKTIERAIAGTDEYYEPPAESDGSTDAHTSASLDQHPERGHQQRLVRIQELEQDLEAALERVAELEAELTAERERRQALEAQLQSDAGVLSRLTSLFTSNAGASGDKE